MPRTHGTNPVSVLRRFDEGVECPACGHGGLDVFFSARDIPVHTVLLMETREEALSYPRRDLELGLCSSCGFVTNVLFDGTGHEYSERYEETQGYSQRFRAFIEEICERLRQRYSLNSNSKVLEIGCGKGEFLALLCEVSGASGVGVDPSFVPSRLESTASDRLRFDPSFYGSQHRGIRPDLICCRHTLEHIADPYEFMKLIASHSENGSPRAISFELPDLQRILDEGAYWDIYYEHCSYFTPGSLARLFRRAGFRPTFLDVEYDDQYVVIDAVADRDASSSSPLSSEESIDSVIQGVERFRSAVEASLSQWGERISAQASQGQKIVVWGGGSKAVAFLGALGLDQEIQAVVDINPHKVGRFLPGSGHEIVPAERLSDLQPHHVIVMNPIYMAEIKGQLERVGVDAKLWPA